MNQMSSAVQKVLPLAIKLTEKQGLLPVVDPKAASLLSAATGEIGSKDWWHHPAGCRIFLVGTVLEKHPDILACRLLRGEITLVHRSLWPALAAVAMSGEAWQNLDSDGIRNELLKSATSSSPLYLRDALEACNTARTRGTRARLAMLRWIEAKLIINTPQFVTDEYQHARSSQCSTWRQVSESREFQPLTDVTAAKRQLEEATLYANLDTSNLPWIKAPTLILGRREIDAPPLPNLDKIASGPLLKPHSGDKYQIYHPLDRAKTVKVFSWRGKLIFVAQQATQIDHSMYIGPYIVQSADASSFDKGEAALDTLCASRLVKTQTADVGSWRELHEPYLEGFRQLMKVESWSAFAKAAKLVWLIPNGDQLQIIATENKTRIRIEGGFSGLNSIELPSASDAAEIGAAIEEAMIKSR